MIKIEIRYRKEGKLFSSAQSHHQISPFLLLFQWTIAKSKKKLPFIVIKYLGIVWQAHPSTFLFAKLGFQIHKKIDTNWRLL
jgi:predicted nucleic acid binding AN1-type Zn finger protein